MVGRIVLRVLRILNIPTLVLQWLTPWALLFVVIGFWLDWDTGRSARVTDAWQLLTAEASGNSGKREALEYLHSEVQLSIPNPYGIAIFGWTVPIGIPPDASRPNAQTPAYWWKSDFDFVPFKRRVPLVGIDLRSKAIIEAVRSGGFPCGDDEMVSGAYLEGLALHVKRSELGYSERAVLIGAKLSCANLRFSNLSYANLNHSRLEGTRFSNATLSGVDFGFASLEGAAIEDSDFRFASFLYANLQRAQIIKTNLDEADFLGADLRRATIVGGSFKGAIFVAAKLRGVVFRGSDLSASDLEQREIDEACTDATTVLPRGRRRPPPCIFETDDRDILFGYERAKVDADGLPLRIPIDARGKDLSADYVTQETMVLVCVDRQTRLQPWVERSKPCRFDKDGKVMLGPDGLPLRIE
jgi:uncharacterized protein YjbI with pentapeptide repeats